MFDDHPLPSDLALMAIRARTTFTYDATGRMLAENEPGHPRAPRFHLGWTPRGYVWRVRDDLPANLVARLAEIMATAAPSADVERPPDCLADVRSALADHAPVDEGNDGGPCYRFPHPIAGRAGAALVAPGAAQVMRRWLPQWAADVATRQPVYAVLVDGDAVAICACARGPGEAAEAGVETHPDFRGHGYAADATAAWARDLRGRGVIPLYSTSWTNTASQHVAAKLGLIRYGASLRIS